MKTTRIIWSLIRYTPFKVLAMVVSWIIVWTIGEQLIGLTIRHYFNSLTSESYSVHSPYVFCAFFAAVIAGRAVTLFANHFISHLSVFIHSSLVRKNLLLGVFEQHGAQALRGSPGEIISKFRGDVSEVARLVVRIAWQIGPIGFCIVAFVYMLSINAIITLIIFIPLLIIICAINKLETYIEKHRNASRKAAGDVTGFLGEVLNAIEAIKANSAEHYAVNRFEVLNNNKRHMVVRDLCFGGIIFAVFQTAMTLGIGAILLVAGRSIRSGNFSTGDFAIFVYYMTVVTGAVINASYFFLQLKQTKVSIKRIEKVTAGPTKNLLTSHQPLYLSKQIPDPAYEPKIVEEKLNKLTLKGLTYSYESGRGGIYDVNIQLERGSITVITGKIGSGKSTLLKVLLGLLPKDLGRIYWNDINVDSPQIFFVPPRAAYTPQIPKLFSQSLKENILHGLPIIEDNLDLAISAAVLEEDIIELSNGIDTLIGPRGAKLSGGQLLRCAAARMFIRKAELNVIDDISSALDIETEKLLWARYIALQKRRHFTSLIVSHKKIVLRLADHIIVMGDGKIIAEGGLDQLLIESDDFRKIWEEEKNK